MRRISSIQSSFSSLLSGPYTPLTTLHHMRIATKVSTNMRFGSTLILLQSFVGGGYSFTVDLPPSISGSSHHTKSTSSSAINYADNSDLDSVIPLPPLDEIIKQQRPVRRRSFLHQLDRFLTDLQGEISFCILFTLYAAITFTFIHLHG